MLSSLASFGRRRRARGQMLLVVATFLMAMSGTALLVFDAGTLYQDRIATTQASDAAAQAAAQDLILRFTDAQIKAAAESYAAQLGATYATGVYIDASRNQVATMGNASAVPYDAWGARGVTITATRAGRTGFFLGMFGQSWASVSTSVTWLASGSAQPAQFGNPPSGQWPGMMRSNVMPMAVPLQALQNATQTGLFDIWNSQYDSSYPGMPAQFKGVWNIDSAVPVSQLGSCALCAKPTQAAQYTTYGYDGVVNNPSTASIESGLLGSNVSNGLRANITAQGLSDATGSYGIFLIAVYDSYAAGADTIHIAGVVGMKIYLNDVTGSSAQGTFVNYTDPAGTPGTSTIAGTALPSWMATDIVRPVN